MEPILIFFPINITLQAPGYLLGYYSEENQLLSKAIYILDFQASYNHKCLPKHPFCLIGTYSTKSRKCKALQKNSYENVWIHILSTDNNVVVEKCYIGREPYNLKQCLLILYNSESIVNSELLLHCRNLFKIDHFRSLASNLQLRSHIIRENNSKYSLKIINFILLVFNFISNILSHFSYFGKYSTLVFHLINYAHSIVWIGEKLKKNKTINLKVGNYLVSLVLDVLAGLLIYCLVTSWKSADGIFDTLLDCAEMIIESINNLVKWLMGSPAGLKLNQPLNNLLGSLVFYYLEIWQNFLSLVRPLLEVLFSVSIKLGFLGLTFQLAMCADILAIMSFHIYCIYVYTARLYEIQAKGLYSLSRLVLGRKRNPEQGKIDSCPYSTEELLIGTISFVVLLFLLPTTLVYYVVFTVMRIGMLLIRGFMTRTIYFMQILPVYSTFLWLFFPCYTATTVKLTPLPSSSSSHGSLMAEVTTSSWFETIKPCMPDAVPPPAPLKFGNILSKIALGKLF